MTDPLGFSYADRPAWRSQLGLLLFSLALTALAALVSVALFAEPGLVPVESGALEPWMPGAIAIAAWAAAGIAVLTLAYRHYEWRYSVADGTIQSRRGIIGRSTRAISLADVRNVNVEQSLVGRPASPAIRSPATTGPAAARMRAITA